MSEDKPEEGQTSFESRNGFWRPRASSCRGSLCLQLGGHVEAIFSICRTIKAASRKYILSSSKGSSVSL
jgi:hypothetical protein